MCFTFFATMIMFASCHYRLYRAKGPDGKTHRVRGYSSYRREHRYFDKVTIRNKYRKDHYQCQVGVIKTSDTSATDDQTNIYVLRDSWNYGPLFTTGIIPIKTLKQLYGKISDIPDYSILFPWQKADSLPANLVVYQFHRLKYIHSGRHHRFYQFKIAPYIYYAEITNLTGRRKYDDLRFWSHAEATWIYRAQVSTL